MTIVKIDSYKGKMLSASASKYCGYRLCDVYDNWSAKKQRAYDYCREQFFKDGGHNFRIISHNSYGFSVAWDTENGIRIETRENSYLIK